MNPCRPRPTWLVSLRARLPPARRSCSATLSGQAPLCARERVVDEFDSPCWRFGAAAVQAEIAHFRRCVEVARKTGAGTEYFLARLERLGAGRRVSGRWANLARKT